MQVNEADFTSSTSVTILPVGDANGYRFAFWNAAQFSNALQEFMGLEFDKHLGMGAQFIVDLYRTQPGTTNLPSVVAVKTARASTAQPSIKKSSVGLAPAGRDLATFIREIQILRHAPVRDHPNILKLLGSSWIPDVDGSPLPQCIVEYAPLGTLRDFLQSIVEPASIQSRMDLCFDVAIGLEFLHSCGIAHGDMKLSNLMVFPGDSEEGPLFRAKISDFGMSVARDDPDEQRVYRGTPGYVPPDVSSGDQLSQDDMYKCDIFAFGLCVWEVMNNGQPHRTMASLHASDRDSASLDTHPSNYSLLDEFDKFLSLHPIQDSGSSRDHRSSPYDTSNLVLPIETITANIKTLVHRSLDPVRTERWTATEMVKYIHERFKDAYCSSGYYSTD
jgi:serine/threonine protein kinase